VARQRGQWRAHQDRLDPSRLVFIDETRPKTNMTPLRGWAPRQRLPTTVPQGHWKTLTFITALRHDRVAAPWLIEGPIPSRELPALRRKGPRPNPHARRHCHHG
jgi:hypothetical protein